VNSAAGAEVDPSVCYRHPDRTSWTLCERCGRTICPECQILTPQGVRCPDCVRETGGSVQWKPAGGSAKAAAAKAKTRRARVTASSDRPAWQRAVAQMLRPEDTSPVVTWTVVGLAVAVWIAGIFTPVLFTILSEFPGTGWQVWRYLTYPVASVPIYGAIYVLSFLLSVVFLLITAPQAEREFGRRRFLVVILASAVTGGALGGIVFGVAFGLSGVLFGIFGSFLILAWPSPAARTRILISIAAYALLTLIFSPAFIGQVIGGVIGGAGAYYLLHRFEDTARGTRRAELIITLVLLGLVAIAVTKSLLA
jgi:membrane associated rhomboid family serine protease